MPDRVRERWSCETHLHACSFDFVCERERRSRWLPAFFYLPCIHATMGPVALEFFAQSSAGAARTAAACFVVQQLAQKELGEKRLFFCRSCCWALSPADWPHEWSPLALVFVSLLHGSLALDVECWNHGAHSSKEGKEPFGLWRLVLVPLDQAARREGLVGWPVKPVPLPSLSPNSLIHLLCSYSQEHSREEKLSSSPLSILWFEPQSSERANSRDWFESSKKIPSLSSPFPWLVVFGERSWKTLVFMHLWFILVALVDCWDCEFLVTLGWWGHRHTGYVDTVVFSKLQFISNWATTSLSDSANMSSVFWS